MSDVIIESDPAQSRLEELHVSEWPIWEKEESGFPWSYDAEETCYFLEGDVEVTTVAGEVFRMGKGGLVTFARGLACTWKVSQAVKKHYTFS